MRKGFPRYKLYTIFFIFCLISSSRFWEFSSSDTIEVESLPWVVLLVRIIPLLIIFFLLFFDDVLHDFKGILQYRKPFLFAVGFYLLISFISALTVYGEIYSAWKTTELIIISYLGAHTLSGISKINLKGSLYVLKSYFTTTLIFAFIIVVSTFLYYEHAFRFSYYQMEAIFPPMNSNALGFFSLGALSYFYFVPHRNIQLKWLSILLFFTFFFLSLSRTAYLAFFFILSLFVLRNIIKLLRSETIKKLRVLSFSLAIIMGLSVFYITKDALIESVTKGQSTEQLSEMSHRVFTWQAAIKSIQQKPFFGYGLVAETRKIVEKYPELVTYKKDSIGNVHSSIFESLLASGLVGALPFLLMLLYFFIRSIGFILFQNLNNRYSNVNLFACVFLIVMLFRGITGSALTLVSFEFVSIILLYATRSFPWQTEAVRND